MSKKNESKKVVAEKTPVAEKAPVYKDVGGGTLQNGEPNFLMHGRLAQGGVIDLFITRSIVTGKEFTLEELNKQIEIDGSGKPAITVSRLKNHIDHLVLDPKHGNMKLQQNAETGRYLGVLTDETKPSLGKRYGGGIVNKAMLERYVADNK